MFSLKSWLRQWNPTAHKSSSRRKSRRPSLEVARLEDRLVPAVLFSEDFSDNNAGWTIGTEWQIGSATLSTGQSTGYGDPAEDHTPTGDNGVAGVRIGGNADRVVHGYYYLTSPVINTAAATAPVTLEFYRWLNSDYAPFMTNRVEAFNGSSWQTLWETGSTGIQDSTWQRQQFDVSAYKNADMRVRFGFSVGSTGVFSVSSWNIDDVTISSADPPPPTGNGLSVQIVGAPSSSPEGVPVALTSTVTDTGGTGPYSYTWSVVKNGAVYATGTPTSDPTFTFTPDDNGTYVVNLTVTALDGRTSSGSTAAPTTDVLIIADTSPINTYTQSLKNALEAAGFNVAIAPVVETLYTGTNPSLTPYEAVIHLDGITWSAAMPVSGQQALAAYVQNGGAYLGSEWLSYEAGSNPYLRDLILFDYGGGDSAPVTYSDVPAQTSHPVLANVPSSFTFQSGRAVSTAHTFATNPVTVLMRDQSGRDAVAVREVGSGRVVGFNHTGNYAGYATLSDPNVQQLYIDGVKWAARLNSGGGTGGSTGGSAATITVTNVAPTATLTTNGPVTELTPVVLNFSNVTDPSSADAAAGFRYSFASAPEGLATSYAAAGTSPTGQLTPLDDGNVTFYARVFDKDGGFRDYPTVVTVTNAAPTATITGGTAAEGSAATVSLINPIDSAADLAQGLRYSFASSAAGLATSYAAAATASSQQFTFADNGSYTVFARVFDKNGAFTDYQTTVTVTNVAPTAVITGAPASSAEGTAITLGSTVTDPGTGDTFSYAWSVTKNGAAYTTGTPSNGPTFTFTPDDNGTYVVNLIVTDDDGGSGVANSASGQIDVLIIYDDASAPGTTALRNALQAAGMNVTLSTTNETLYSGTNPSLGQYEAVIHLNGTTWPTDMPLAGQQALVSYVQNGGAYIGSEWNAYEFGQGRLQQMRDLILFNSVSTNGGSVTLTDVAGQSAHPVLANVPSPAFYTGSFNVGSVRSYAVQPATVLMRDQYGNDAVAVRDFGTGRVVAFHHSGNYSGALTDDDVLQLYVDGVKWAGRPVLTPGVTITVTNVAPTVAITGAPANSPEGTAITLGSAVTDPGGASDPLTYTWSVTKNGVAYATGTPTGGTTFTFTPDDDGTYVVNLTVTDGDGGTGSVTSAPGQIDVLIIYDVISSYTLSLQSALQAAGMNVALSTTDETLYSGTNPSLGQYEAVIHLNGTTPNVDMPAAGQQALVSYVQNGGAYIGSEWNAYEFAQGRLQQMRDLILFNFAGYGFDTVNFTDVPGLSDHPVLATAPSTFSLFTGHIYGNVYQFAAQPATVLMRDQFGSAAVAVRDFGTGRVVGLNQAGNNGTVLADPNLQKLYIDGIKWASRGGAQVGVPITVTNVAPALADVTATPAHEGGTVTVAGRIVDPGASDTHTVTIAWGDGTTSTATVNADRTFTAAHVYRDDGPTGTPSDVYQIGIAVRDNGGGSGGIGAAELVPNGGFEAGLTGWTVSGQGGNWVLNSGTFDPDGPGTPTAPISGQFDALATQTGPSRLLLSAPIVVPSGISSAVLSWSDRIRNHFGQFADPNQEWRVQVLGASGGPLATVFSTNPGDPAQQLGPNQRSFDLTQLLQGLAGQTIYLSFELEDNLFYFNVNLDDVSLLVTTGPGVPVTISNVAPTAPVLQVSPGVGEDGTVTLTGTFTDAGVDDTHTVTVDWGDGTQTVIGGGATVPVSAAVEYNGHRYYVIRQQGLSWFEAQEQAQRLGGNLATINDAAENMFVSELLRSNFGYYALAWIGINDEAHEGQFGWVSGEPVTYTNWFVQDGEPNDYPPQVTEDFVLTNYAYGYGPGWWNDVSGTNESGIAWGAYAVVEVNPARTFTLSHRYADDNAAGAYTINVTVTDDDTGTSSATATATVTNAAPTDLTVTADAVTINEDGSVTLTGSFTDRGAVDTHTVTIDWKDGTTSQVTVPAFPGTPSAGVNLAASAEFQGHTYHFISTPLSWEAAEAEARRMGGHLVTINSGAENLFLFEYIRRAARTGDVQVWTGLSNSGANGALQWASGEALGYTSWAAEQPVNWPELTGIAFNFNNTAIGARWGGFAAGAPLFAVIEVDGKRTFSATHHYLDDPAGTAGDVYTIGVTVTDDDGGSASASVPVTVSNIAPVIGSLTGPVAGVRTVAAPGGAAVTFTGVRGQPLPFSVAFTDTGALDTHEVRWDFGDGTVSAWLPAPGSAATAPAHAYAAAGTYTITVTVRDDDGGTVSFARQVEVKALELQVDPNDPTKTALVIGGTVGDDQLQLSGGGNTVVVLNGAYLGMFAYTGSLVAFTQDGNDQIQVSGNFGDAVVDAGAGSDSIQLSGTFRDARITAGPGADTVQVSGNFRDATVDTGTENDQVQISGTFRDVVVNAGAGNDSVQMSGNFATATVLAGDGDDNVQVSGQATRIVLSGGSGNDVLRVNGNAPAVLVGGDGNDELYGSSGRNLLIGGRGADTVIGGSGEDVLIAGFTAYDDDLGALTALHGVWVDATKTYAQRVAALRSAATLANGVRLNSSTVFRDDSADVLTGRAGQDWFLFDPTHDQVTDVGSDMFDTEGVFVGSP